MGKRFTETTKWEDKWFLGLKPEHKLLWLFICDRCDNVGVWNENLELATLLLGYDYPIERVLEAFGDRILRFKNNTRWWVKGFVKFQYGELKPTKCPPHRSYVRLLEEHGLWKGYRKGIVTPQEKEQEQVKEQEQEKDRDRAEWCPKCGKETTDDYGICECEPLPF